MRAVWVKSWGKSIKAVDYYFGAAIAVTLNIKALAQLEEREENSDPVYKAKSFAAVLGLLNEGMIPSASWVLFNHTDGLGAFFAYQKGFWLIQSRGNRWKISLTRRDWQSKVTF